MEIVEEQLLLLAIYMLKKAKIEKQLRKTFRCFLRKMFSCCGMKNIENELKFLNNNIENIKLEMDIKRCSLIKDMKKPYNLNYTEV